MPKHFTQLSVSFQLVAKMKYQRISLILLLLCGVDYQISYSKHLVPIYSTLDISFTDFLDWKQEKWVEKVKSLLPPILKSLAFLPTHPETFSSLNGSNTSKRGGLRTERNKIESLRYWRGGGGRGITGCSREIW